MSFTPAGPLRILSAAAIIFHRHPSLTVPEAILVDSPEAEQ